MDNKALYLLAQFDDSTQMTLKGYYDILCHNNLIGEQTKDIPYHFTLGSYNLNMTDEVLYNLEHICSETNCIDIKLDHIGLFGLKLLKVLFIEPNMNIELLTLQHKLFNNCGYGCHPWTAHVTILMDEPNNILKAIPILTEHFQPFKAQIESIGVYEFFPKKFIEEFKLN